MAKAGKIKFVVGKRAGARSAIWTISPNKKGDIYIGNTATMGAFKASLHASGRWRIAFDQEYARETPGLLPPGADRVVGRLDPPKPVALGLSRIFTILIPGTALAYHSSYTTIPEDVAVLPPIDFNHVVEVSVVATQWRAYVRKWPGQSDGYVPIKFIPLEDSKALWALYKVRVIFRDEERELAKHHELMATRWRFLYETDLPEVLRSIVWGPGAPDGSAFFGDIARHLLVERNERV